MRFGLCEIRAEHGAFDQRPAVMPNLGRHVVQAVQRECRDTDVLDLVVIEQELGLA
ncbi:hypothetical protein [Acidovorax facilis]|uniref:hypothetical protein n=1 Tax=Acidovorax facilis TaxID=12917 RepID=UPI003D657F04